MVRQDRHEYGVFEYACEQQPIQLAEVSEKLPSYMRTGSRDQE